MFSEVFVWKGDDCQVLEYLLTTALSNTASNYNHIPK